MQNLLNFPWFWKPKYRVFSDAFLIIATLFDEIEYK